MSFYDIKKTRCDHDKKKLKEMLAKNKQNIYGFSVKNLDLDSNLYNLKKRIKKAS